MVNVFFQATIEFNGFSMVFDFVIIAFNGFRWFSTIDQTMRWFRWIVVVYLADAKKNLLLIQSYKCLLMVLRGMSKAGCFLLSFRTLQQKRVFNKCFSR